MAIGNGLIPTGALWLAIAKDAATELLAVDSLQAIQKSVSLVLLQQAVEEFETSSSKLLARTTLFSNNVSLSVFAGHDRERLRVGETTPWI
jgi:hypothetical protein